MDNFKDANHGFTFTQASYARICLFSRSHYPSHMSGVRKLSYYNWPQQPSFDITIGHPRSCFTSPKSDAGWLCHGGKWHVPCQERAKHSAEAPWASTSQRWGKFTWEIPTKIEVWMGKSSSSPTFDSQSQGEKKLLQTPHHHDISWPCGYTPGLQNLTIDGAAACCSHFWVSRCQQSSFPGFIHCPDIATLPTIVRW